MTDQTKCWTALIAQCRAYTEMTFDELCRKPAWRPRVIYNYSKPLMDKYQNIPLSRIFCN